MVFIHVGALGVELEYWYRNILL